MELTPEKRLDISRKVIAVAFLLGIAMSWRLWMDWRTFPLLPVFGDSPFLPAWISIAVTVTLIACLGFLIFKWNNRVAWVLLGSLVLLVMNDQNRLQAWVYFYVLMLFVFALDQPKEKNIFYLRMILVAVYTWSGIHKCHEHFTGGTWIDILTRLFGMEYTDAFRYEKLGYALPAIEILVGLLLLIPMFRNVGCCMGIGMHLFVLVYLSPLGIEGNYVVVPWNLAMMGLLYVVFCKSGERLHLFQNLRRDVRAAFLFIVVGIMPIFSFYGAWDHYLSFSYYSNKTSSFYMVLPQTTLSVMKEDLSKYYMADDMTDGGKIIDVNAWSMGELNVPLYPQSRVFDKFRMYMCASGIPMGNAHFMEFRIEEEVRMIDKKCGDE